MGESIQVTPSVNTATAQSKMSSLDSADNAASTDDSEGFTAVFASYTESETDTEKQKQDENLTDLLHKLLPQNISDDVNSLPQVDAAIMWQAAMLLQPGENVATHLSSPQSQNIGLFDNARQPVFNASLLNQDYFNNLAMQSKTIGTNSLPAGLATNNITAQLSAAHFIPEAHESLLLNVNEQLLPIQGTSTSLSPGLAAVGFASATQAANTQTQMAPLNLGQNAWETNLGSRLQMLIGQNVQTAEIRLDPPELGVLDIKIKVSNDVVTVNITSPHTQVKEALESAIPRLREMFEGNGLSLGDVNVRQESSSQQQHMAEENDNKLMGLSESEFDDEPVTINRRIVSDNLLDFYA